MKRHASESVDDLKNYTSTLNDIKNAIDSPIELSVIFSKLTTQILSSFNKQSSDDVTTLPSKNALLELLTEIARNVQQFVLAPIFSTSNVENCDKFQVYSLRMLTAFNVYHSDLTRTLAQHFDFRNVRFNEMLKIAPPSKNTDQEKQPASRRYNMRKEALDFLVSFLIHDDADYEASMHEKPDVQTTSNKQPLLIRQVLEKWLESRCLVKNLVFNLASSSATASSDVNDATTTMTATNRNNALMVLKLLLKIARHSRISKKLKRRIFCSATLHQLVAIYHWRDDPAQSDQSVDKKQKQRQQKQQKQNTLSPAHFAHQMLLCVCANERLGIVQSQRKFDWLPLSLSNTSWQQQLKTSGGQLENAHLLEVLLSTRMSGCHVPHSMKQQLVVSVLNTAPFLIGPFLSAICATPGSVLSQPPSLTAAAANTDITWTNWMRLVQRIFQSGGEEHEDDNDEKQKTETEMDSQHKQQHQQQNQLSTLCKCVLEAAKSLVLDPLRDPDWTRLSHVTLSLTLPPPHLDSTLFCAPFVNAADAVKGEAVRLMQQCARRLEEAVRAVNQLDSDVATNIKHSLASLLEKSRQFPDDAWRQKFESALETQQTLVSEQLDEEAVTQCVQQILSRQSQIQPADSLSQKAAMTTTTTTASPDRQAIEKELRADKSHCPSDLIAIIDWSEQFEAQQQEGDLLADDIFSSELNKKFKKFLIKLASHLSDESADSQLANHTAGSYPMWRALSKLAASFVSSNKSNDNSNNKKMANHNARAQQLLSNLLANERMFWATFSGDSNDSNSIERVQSDLVKSALLDSIIHLRVWDWLEQRHANRLLIGCRAPYSYSLSNSDQKLLHIAYKFCQCSSSTSNERGVPFDPESLFALPASSMARTLKNFPVERNWLAYSSDLLLFEEDAGRLDPCSVLPSISALLHSLVTKKKQEEQEEELGEQDEEATAQDQSNQKGSRLDLIGRLHRARIYQFVIACLSSNANHIRLLAFSCLRALLTHFFSESSPPLMEDHQQQHRHHHQTGRKEQQHQQRDEAEEAATTQYQLIRCCLQSVRNSLIGLHGNELLHQDSSIIGTANQQQLAAPRISGLHVSPHFYKFRLPSVHATFFVRALELLHNAEKKSAALFEAVWSSMLAKPSLSLNAMPEFDRFFFSCAVSNQNHLPPHHHQQQQHAQHTQQQQQRFASWAIQLAADSLHTRLDLEVLRRSHVLPLLLSMYSSQFVLDVACKKEVLSLLSRAVFKFDLAKVMIDEFQLHIWLHQNAYSARKHDQLKTKYQAVVRRFTETLQEVQHRARSQSETFELIIVQLEKIHKFINT